MKHLSSSRRLPSLGGHSSRYAAVTAACTMLLLATDVKPQESAFVEEAQEVTATVNAVDPEKRLVTLRAADGEEMIVEAGEEVRNFEQVEVGDRVDVVYHEALLAEVTEAPSDAGSEPVFVETTRAPAGAKPEGTVGIVYTAIVTIDAVDLENNTVTFTGPRGLSREMAVERPEMQEFIARLKPGDHVQVTYGESLAVSVTPAQ